MASSGSIGVRATFTIRGEVVHSFASEEREEKIEAVESANGYQYSGTHDGGILPPLKAGGPHSVLLAALLDAKDDSDAFMTAVIAEEKAAGGSADAESELPQESEEGLAEEEEDTSNTAEDDAASELERPT